MDPRARAALERRKYTPNPKWRSRRVVPEDLAKFDFVLALDAVVLKALQELWPGTPRHRLHLLLDHLPGHVGQDVPDPYYSSAAGFDRALDLIERSVPELRLVQALARATASCAPSTALCRTSAMVRGPTSGPERVLPGA